jgi:hypothetical protein
MGGKGFEPPSKPSGKSTVASKGGAECGALSGDSDPATPPPDPDLTMIVTRWPSLPKPIRAGLVALVRSALDTGAAR